MSLTHLQRLEAEAIHIMREVVAEASNPVMLYSVGKDSSVMLHLARKAFYPSPPPFPFLHIASGWDFQDLLAHRDRTAKEYGIEVIVAQNEQAEEQGINPFDTGSAMYSQAQLTDPLKRALTEHGFDAAFGGGRRDEEKARAKERIFSFRTASHRWDPKNQRPELWNIYNAKKNKGKKPAPQSKTRGKKLPNAEVGDDLDAELAKKLGVTIQNMRHDFIMAHLAHQCTQCRKCIADDNRW